MAADLPGLRPQRVPGASVRALAATSGLVLDAAAAGADAVVLGITHDSRAVRPGDLFAALPGARVHGATFAAQVVAAGAAALLTDADGLTRARTDGVTVPVLVADRPREVLGGLAAHIYGNPGADLLLVAVTGTNGKTTVTHLLHDLLTAHGRRVGLVGTVETRIGERRIPAVRTTPEATDLHALLAVMREDGADACVMEVSSHALVLGRVGGVRFDVAAFTNLSQDHLDFHGDMEGYFAAKASLFVPTRAGQAVVCVDDAWGRRLVEETPLPVVRVAGIAPASTAIEQEQGADWQVLAVDQRADLQPTALVRVPGGAQRRLRMPLPGRFNVTNGVLAAAVAVAVGCPLESTLTALAAAQAVPGRMERVRAAGIAPAAASGDDTGVPAVVVDYAHTPDAIEQVLQTLRPATPGRLWVVLGAGGDRDAGKRPGMGAAAAGGADVVVVTDDNPRSEDPAAIRRAVLTGAREAAARSGATVVEVGDRAEAVRAAIMQADPGDVVLLAGKGHEQGQEAVGVVHPFDDRTAAAQALTERLAAGVGGGSA
jgi:UDP-N-acetylmuramoyl-L-alanyl-D-glutamate--2,6-diaminopimelate ligase